MDVQTFHNHDGLTAGKTIKEETSGYEDCYCDFSDRPKVLERAKAGCADSLWYKDHGEEEISDVINRTLKGESDFSGYDAGCGIKLDYQWRNKSKAAGNAASLYLWDVLLRDCKKNELFHFRVRWNFQEMITRAGYSCKEDLIAAALESKLIVTTLK